MKYVNMSYFETILDEIGRRRDTRQYRQYREIASLIAPSRLLDSKEMSVVCIYRGGKQ